MPKQSNRRFLWVAIEAMAYDATWFQLLTDDRQGAIEACREHYKELVKDGHYTFTETDDGETWVAEPHNPKTGEVQQFGTYFTVSRVVVNGKWGENGYN
jgi:hypothetical protein